MERLVKGLLDVALGGDDDDRNQRQEDGTDERSRSTSWAQVVSGGEDHEQKYGGNHNNNNRRSEETQTANEGYEDGRQGGYNQRQPEAEDGNDGWETVGKKPPRRHQQVRNDNWDNFKRPASEQEYSNEVEDNSQLEPSQTELDDLGKACNKLWELDYNRLTPGKDYEIDCGEGKKSYQNQDMAEGSLFTWLSEDVLRKPTISRFCSLLDNYNPHEGYKEQVTSQEKQEQAAFIEEICRTAPVKYLYKYLCAKGVVSGDYQEFKRLLTSLWFDL